MAAITDLATLAAAAANDDWLVVHDLSVTTDKKISRANLLGESGTWTPTLQFGGGTTGITYGTQSGRYNRIGDLVWIGLQIVLTSKGSSTGAATIITLPFAYSGVAATFSAYWQGLASGVHNIVAVTAGSTTLGMYYTASAATGVSAMTDAIFGNTTTIWISGCYRTS